MTRLLACALAALAALATPAIAADGIQPVCGSRDVLAVVAERLHRAGQALTLDPAIGETPDVQPGTVHCAVRVHTLIHDTARYGPWTLDRVSTYRFRLDLRQNGIFLADDP